MNQVENSERPKVVVIERAHEADSLFFWRTGTYSPRYQSPSSDWQRNAKETVNLILRNENSVQMASHTSPHL